MRPEARGWWEQAGEDLASARVNQDVGRYYVTAFFCQQAAEKALKAVWIEKRRELPPKTHDLAELAAGLGVPEGLQTGLLEINPAYATARYPDAANGLPARAFNAEIAGRLLTAAEDVLQWCESQLSRS